MNAILVVSLQREVTSMAPAAARLGKTLEQVYKTLVLLFRHMTLSLVCFIGKLPKISLLLLILVLVCTLGIFVCFGLVSSSSLKRAFWLCSTLHSVTRVGVARENARNPVEGGEENKPNVLLRSIVSSERRRSGRGKKARINHALESNQKPGRIIESNIDDDRNDD